MKVIQQNICTIGISMAFCEASYYKADSVGGVSAAAMFSKLLSHCRSSMGLNGRYCAFVPCNICNSTIYVD